MVCSADVLFLTVVPAVLPVAAVARGRRVVLPDSSRVAVVLCTRRGTSRPEVLRERLAPVLDNALVSVLRALVLVGRVPEWVALLD